MNTDFSLIVWRVTNGVGSLSDWKLFLIVPLLKKKFPLGLFPEQGGFLG